MSDRFEILVYDINVIDLAALSASIFYFSRVYSIIVSAEQAQTELELLEHGTALLEVLVDADVAEMSDLTKTFFLESPTYIGANRSRNSMVFQFSHSKIAAAITSHFRNIWDHAASMNQIHSEADFADFDLSQELARSIPRSFVSLNKLFGFNSDILDLLRSRFEEKDGMILRLMGTRRVQLPEIQS